jgi:chemotaxis protein methyltransferase CheR
MPGELREILEKVYKERGFDFRQYKESSLKRRIERRLRALRLEAYKDYMARLDSDPMEYDKLIDILLINVTEFFRDKEAFNIIKNEVLPDIIEKNIRPGLKIWSAGCATGEEVYSIAILLNEMLGDKKNNLEISIYGTDIDKNNLAKAEEGVYKPGITKDKLSDEILNKYFDASAAPNSAFQDGVKVPCSASTLSVSRRVDMNGSVRIKDFLKRDCSFMFRDLVRDKPLGEVDLILCRNVAIYFERPLQERIYMDFYNALNEEGYLFLGKAETLIGPARERFKVVDKRWKIYKKEVK